MVGLCGQSGSIVLAHVGEDSHRELVHVPTHRLSLEVSFVVVIQKKQKRVKKIRVQVSVCNKMDFTCQ